MLRAWAKDPGRRLECIYDGKTRPDGEWNNWGKARYNRHTKVKGRRTKSQTTEDFLSLSGAGMGAAAASGAVAGAVGGATQGTIRGVVSNMM